MGRLPLFVDLDGTLTSTDTLLECLVRRLKHRPADLLQVPFWLLSGRAQLKAKLAEQDPMEVERLPYRDDFLNYLQQERASGRRIILATGADRSIAERVAAHLGIFDAVLASDGEANLTGKRKLEAIHRMAPDGFDYAGNSRADLAIWKQANAAILVNTPHRVVRQASQSSAIERIFDRSKIRPSELLHAIRMHQWLKNLLVFVALLTSFRMTDASAVAEAVMAFFAFSFCASAVYVINDLIDLDADRAHPRKRFRPFASGRISIGSGLVMASLLLTTGLTLAFFESLGLFAVILIYLATTTAYSWDLKSRVLVDVVVLAMLYVMRIVGGAYAIGVPTSMWLLAFALFIFLSLALAKRCSELVSMESIGLTRARGRGYRVEDLKILWPVGVATGVCSVLVFALFVSADELPEYYSAPSLLWLVALTLFYWLAYIWLKTSRGEMYDDPLVFAIKDVSSRITIGIAVLITIAAHFVQLPDSGMWLMR